MEGNTAGGRLVHGLKAVRSLKSALRPDKAKTLSGSVTSVRFLNRHKISSEVWPNQPTAYPPLHVPRLGPRWDGRMPAQESENEGTRSISITQLSEYRVRAGRVVATANLWAVRGTYIRNKFNALPHRHVPGSRNLVAAISDDRLISPDDRICAGCSLLLWGVISMLH